MRPSSSAATIEALDPLDSVRYTAATGAGVVDWDVSTSSLDPTRRSTLRTQFGAALLGGDKINPRDRRAQQRFHGSTFLLTGSNPKQRTPSS